MLFASNNNRAVVLPGGGQLIRSRSLLMPKWWLIGRRLNFGSAQASIRADDWEKKEGGNTSALWQKEGEGCDTINYSGPMIYGTTD